MSNLSKKTSSTLLVLAMNLLQTSSCYITNCPLIRFRDQYGMIHERWSREIDQLLKNQKENTRSKRSIEEFFYNDQTVYNNSEACDNSICIADIGVLAVCFLLFAIFFGFIFYKKCYKGKENNLNLEIGAIDPLLLNGHQV